MIKVKLKEILNDKGLTITELHERTGISKNTLSLMVNEKSKGIQYDTLDKILKATNVGVSDLLEETQNSYCLFVKGIDNNYTCLKDFENRNFRYQVWLDDQIGEKELLYDFNFTVLYFIVNNANKRPYFHISFSNENPIEKKNPNLAVLFNSNTSKFPINAIAFLIVTDMLWNMNIEGKHSPSLAYFDWVGIERNNGQEINNVIPIKYAELKHNSFKEKKVNGIQIADFDYLKLISSEIDSYLFDNETGKSAVFITINIP